MNHIHHSLFLASLLSTGLTAEAVQLGSVKGAAIFGHPLDVSVQVRLDAPVKDIANCFNADIFQADNKFDVGRVRIDVARAANGLDGTVRIRSATVIREPWAKVILSSNCGAKITRQYGLLTISPNNAPAGTAFAEAIAAPNVANAANTTIVSSAVKSSRSASGSTPASNAHAKRAFKAKSDALIIQPVTAHAKKTADSATNTAASTAESRLKMETFELTDEHQVLLKLSNSLIAPTGMRTPAEIQALAQATAVWRAINGMPSATASSITPGVTEATPIVAIAPAAAPTFINQMLAGKPEFTKPLVYGLAGLLAVAFGCVAWLWLRLRKASRDSYGWLTDSALTDTNDDADPFVEQETKQTWNSNNKNTESHFVDQVEAEPALDTSSDVVITIDEAPAANASVDMHAAEAENSLTTVAHNYKKPSQINTPRFDERILRHKMTGNDIAPEVPAAASTASIDLVFTGTESPAKLQTADGTTLPELAIKPSVIVANKPTMKPLTAKDDSKGNLIDFDFDIFSGSK